MRKLEIGAAIVLLLAWNGPVIPGADLPPQLASITVPQGGWTQILFRSQGEGPFRLQSRLSMAPSAPWVEVTEAVITKIEPGIYMVLCPKGLSDMAFFRILSETDTIAELKGWALLLQVSAPGNRQYFVPNESPIVTVTVLDTLLQGVSRTNFSTLNLYMYGPQEPQQTVTAVKLLNASTDRSQRPHHYIDLKTNPDVQINGNVLTYRLRPVTSEAPGTYRVSVFCVLESDAIQQVMKFADVQIGTTNVESAVVTKTQCASCHEGAISGKMYMHHIDPGFSPTGNWSLDYLPVSSCKSCHNNDGYAAIKDASGAFMPDPIVRRVHGVHAGEELTLDFNTNAVTGDFRNYTHVKFPADVRNCTKCHVDDRWQTGISRMACSACHDSVWFGAKDAVPTGLKAHSGGPATSDSNCVLCHDPEGAAGGVDESHKISPPNMDAIDVAMTPPANGKFYVAGEKPVLTLVFKDDTGRPIPDHTKVSDVNFSTASLFVYGPRSRTVPVLTSSAKNVNSKLRASVTSSKAGPWDINGKIFRLSINGSAPQDVIITGVSNRVTAAEVSASLNSVITNLNGGAKATVSGANVNIKTVIQGSKARIEIYDGDVTSAMGWKRAPNTILEPDVTVAAGSLPSNDLRLLADPLDYSDPMVNRTATNIIYQLDDVAGLPAGTYGIYVYHLPRAGKIAGLNAPTGIGHAMFQVGTATPEKKVATNCRDCHGDTIWHLTEGPIHAEPFDTDYCNACHDYSHTSTGDMFKNQGGTSLSGWSGFGAMPIVRRVHGVHFGRYLERPEEIYANATKDTFGHIIFPQDVRNCTKCHAESNTWKEKPSRMACLACHDSDYAKFHGRLMTYIPDASDPYGPAAVETCVVCHGADSEFSADKVHNITKPFVPPYRREPVEP